MQEVAVVRLIFEPWQTKMLPRSWKSCSLSVIWTFLTPQLSWTSPMDGGIDIIHVITHRSHVITCKSHDHAWITWSAKHYSWPHSFVEVEKDVIILKKKSADSPFHSFMGKGIINLPPQEVYDSLRNPQLRFTYDNMLKELHIVKQIEEGLYICKYMYNRLPTLCFPVGPLVPSFCPSTYLSPLSVCLLVPFRLSTCLDILSVSSVHLHHETTQCFIKQSRDFCILVSERSEVRQDSSWRIS